MGNLRDREWVEIRTNVELKVEIFTCRGRSNVKTTFGEEFCEIFFAERIFGGD